MNNYNNQKPDYYDEAEYDTNQPQRCYVLINVADMIRETFNGIIALNASLNSNGSQQPLLQSNVENPQVVRAINAHSTMQRDFIGAFGNNGYGVYDNLDKFEGAVKFGSRPMAQKFQTYEEALAFAKNGVAKMNGISVDEIPEMQYYINWWQII